MLAAVLALAVTLAVAPLVPRTIFVFAFAAVPAWFGGVGPGLLAAFLCVAGVDYFLIPPRSSSRRPRAAGRRDV